MFIKSLLISLCSLTSIGLGHVAELSDVQSNPSYQWNFCYKNAARVLITCNADSPQGTMNSVQYCCQNAANGHNFQCSSTGNPFQHQPQARNQKLASAQLDGGNIVVIGTDGTVNKHPTGKVNVAELQVISDLLVFAPIHANTSSLNTSRVYTSVPLIPTTSDCGSLHTSAGSNPTKAVMFGVDESNPDAEPEVSIFTPCVGQRGASFKPVVGKWNNWISGGSTYVLLKGLTVCESSPLGSGSSNEKAANTPILSVGGTTALTSNQITLFCASDSSLNPHGLNLKLKVARSFASVVWDLDNRKVTICGGQALGGQLLTSCEQIDFNSMTVRHGNDAAPC